MMPGSQQSPRNILFVYTVDVDVAGAEPGPRPEPRPGTPRTIQHVRTLDCHCVQLHIVVVSDEARYPGTCLSAVPDQELWAPQLCWARMFGHLIINQFGPSENGIRTQQHSVYNRTAVIIKGCCAQLAASVLTALPQPPPGRCQLPGPSEPRRCGR